MAEINAPLKDQILGHQKTIENLLGLIRNQKLSSTYLFVGPSGIGKKLVAKALAQALVCEAALKPCGHCGPCLRIIKGTSESLLEIQASGVQIKIEQAKDVLEFCRLAHHSSRIIIIDQGESLNPQAANTLLKLLEEPPKNTYFFILVPSVQSVLPTIRSRCQVVRFGLLPKKQIKAKFQVADWIIESSGGRMDQIESLQSTENIELRSRAKTWLEFKFQKKVQDIIPDLKEKGLKREDTFLMIKFWREFLRDIWFLKQNLTPIIHADQTWDAQVLNGITFEKLDYTSRSLDQIEFGLRGFSDVSLSLEHFLRAD